MYLSVKIREKLMELVGMISNKLSARTGSSEEGVNEEEAIMQLIDAVNQLNDRLTKIEETIGAEMASKNEELSKLSKDNEELSKKLDAVNQLNDRLTKIEETIGAEMASKNEELSKLSKDNEELSKKLVPGFQEKIKMSKTPVQNSKQEQIRQRMEFMKPSK